MQLAGCSENGECAFLTFSGALFCSNSLWFGNFSIRKRERV